MLGEETVGGWDAGSVGSDPGGWGVCLSMCLQLSPEEKHRQRGVHGCQGRAEGSSEDLEEGEEQKGVVGVLSS